MGGAVKVVVRESDGTVHNMCRWTNNLTWWLHRPEFITNPDKLLKEYIEAKKDSAYYSENDTLSPEGYGLVVIDAVTKTILSHQDYTDLNQTYGARWALDFKLHETLNWNLITSEIPFINIAKFRKEVQETNAVFAHLNLSRDEDNDILTMKRDYELFMMGNIVASREILKNLEKNEEKKWVKSSMLKNYRELMDRLGKVQKRSIEDWKFFLKYIQKNRNISFLNVKTNFKVTDFNRTNESPIIQYQKFMEKLVSLNFYFTKRDIKAWDEYLKNYEDE